MEHGSISIVQWLAIQWPPIEPCEPFPSSWAPLTLLHSRPLPRRARPRRPAKAKAGARKWTDPTGSKPRL